MNLPRQKLQAAQDECAQHLQRMSYAYGNISRFLPLAAAQLDTLTNEQVEALDQYIYRFTKLQDAMGERLFKHTLNLLAEDTRSMPFIDRLNRLEQLGALESTQQWLDLRHLRNLLAHEYANNAEEKAAAINLVFSQYQHIKKILTRFTDYLAALGSKH